MTKPACTFKDFMRDVRRHELIVHRDDGVYRHITGKAPGTGMMHFNIVTFPGYLVYTGDMGAYTFCRTNDMFTFFRQKPGRIGYINPHYWSEKLEATDCNGKHVSHGADEWSDDAFKAVIIERFNDYFDGIAPDEYEPEEKHAAFQAMKDEAQKQVHDEILSCEDLRNEGYRAANEFKHESSGLEFVDLYDHDFNEWTHRFLWACYAITWAIEKYDQRPEVPAAISWPRDSEGAEVRR